MKPTAYHLHQNTDLHVEKHFAFSISFSVGDGQLFRCSGVKAKACHDKGTDHIRLADTVDQMKQNHVKRDPASPTFISSLRADDYLITSELESQNLWAFSAFLCDTSLDLLTNCE